MVVMIAEVIGPWRDVEATDESGATYRDQRRLPQFLHDVGSMPWRDVAAQAALTIPPTPSLGIWRVWCSAEQLAAFAANPAYTVLRAAEVNAENVDAGEWPALAVTKERSGSADAFPPLPESGWLEAGAVYQWECGAVIVRQAHSRTEHAPEDVPALFVVYRADATGTLEWVAGEQVVVGTRRTYEGVEYECLQSHVTQVDWQPDITPALWRVVVTEPATGAWSVGMAYKVGDAVSYEGAEYRCRQAHTSQAGWTPPVVPALWELVP